LVEGTDEARAAAEALSKKFEGMNRDILKGTQAVIPLDPKVALSGSEKERVANAINLVTQIESGKFQSELAEHVNKFYEIDRIDVEKKKQQIELSEKIEEAEATIKRYEGMIGREKARSRIDIKLERAKLAVLTEVIETVGGREPFLEDEKYREIFEGMVFENQAGIAGARAVMQDRNEQATPDQKVAAFNDFLDPITKLSALNGRKEKRITRDKGFWTMTAENAGTVPPNEGLEPISTAASQNKEELKSVFSQLAPDTQKATRQAVKEIFEPLAERTRQAMIRAQESGEHGTFYTGAGKKTKQAEEAREDFEKSGMRVIMEFLQDTSKDQKQQTDVEIRRISNELEQ